MCTNRYVNLELLKSTAERLGLKPDEIALSTGIGKQTVKSVFKGMIPSKAFQVAIAEALELRREDLFPEQPTVARSPDEATSQTG